MKPYNLIGQRFSRLTVIGKSPVVRHVGSYWICKCDCGETTEVASQKLRKGNIKSCGCWRREFLANGSNRSHGRSHIGDRTYKSWKEMRNRCLNSNAHNFQWYGGRGIKVCGRWDNFEAFLADMGERPENHTLDRLNSDGNYCPENCRWATPKEQATTNRGVFKKGLIPHNKRKGVETTGIRVGGK